MVLFPVPSAQLDSPLGTAGQKEFLKDLLNRKKTAELENLPMEEIEKRMAALDSETVDESATT